MGGTWEHLWTSGLCQLPWCPWDRVSWQLPGVAWLLLLPAHPTHQLHYENQCNVLLLCCFFLFLSDCKVETLKIKVNFTVVLQGKTESKISQAGNSLGCSLHLKVIGCLSLVALFHALFWNLSSYVSIVFHAVLNKTLLILEWTSDGFYLPLLLCSCFVALYVVQSPVPEFSSLTSFNCENFFFTGCLVALSFLRCADVFRLVSSLTQMILMLFAILAYFPFVQFPVIWLTWGDMLALFL